MTSKGRVLVIGLEPTLVDFDTPELAGSGMNADKVRAALARDAERLQERGYDAETLLTDLGETAEAVVRERLTQARYGWVVIGAGIRVLPKHFLLFEKLINVIHEHAPRARICFNTKPDDTADAVERWV